MSEHTTWLSALMEDSEMLLKHKLKELNDMDPEDVDGDDVKMIKDAYEAIHHMEATKKLLAEPK